MGSPAPAGFGLTLALLLIPAVHAATIEYPAAGNIRADAGTLELWCEVPFDVATVTPSDLWLPSHAFFLQQEGDALLYLLFRFQSIPEVKNADGTLLKQRTDGVCFSAKGDAAYFRYGELGIKGNEPIHLAFTWDGADMSGFCNGKQTYLSKPGTAGDMTVAAVFKFDPNRSFMRIGLSNSPELLRVYAVRISNTPHAFKPMQALPKPQVEMDTLFFDDFSSIKTDDKGATVIPRKAAPMVREGVGILKGGWHKGTSAFGNYVALWPAETPLKALIPAK
jgi:hypothetical protein